MSKYVEVYSVAVQSAALDLCRGSYQRAVVTGHQSLSGSTLRGLAKKYASRYADSVKTLLSRIRQHRLDVREIRRDHNRRVLCFGLSAHVGSVNDVLSGRTSVAECFADVDRSAE